MKKNTPSSSASDNTAPEPLPPGFTLVDQQAWAEAQAAAAQLAEARERAIRMQADFDNFRKRLTREKEDAIRYANESLLEALLPVIDNFELGLQAAATATDPKTIVQGMSMVLTQLQRFLSECGVEEIQTAGALFDPHLHEAIGQEPCEDRPEGYILSQRRKGYKLRDRLLRPAAVIVATAPEPTPQT
jgi:molecular chaperone GrpE